MNDKVYFAGVVDVNVHIPISYGEIGQRFGSANTDTASGPVADLYGNGGFGPASGYGLRASLTLLEAMVWKGLTIRLSGYYDYSTTRSTWARRSWIRRRVTSRRAAMPATLLPVPATPTSAASFRSATSTNLPPPPPLAQSRTTYARSHREASLSHAKKRPQQQIGAARFMLGWKSSRPERTAE